MKEEKQSLFINYQPSLNGQVCDLTNIESQRVRPKTHLSWSVINTLCGFFSFYT
jgi:hypothetical protein